MYVLIFYTPQKSFKIFKQIIPLQPFLLLHTSMNINSWKVLVLQQLAQSLAPGHGFDEDDHLVKL